MRAVTPPLLLFVLAALSLPFLDQAWHIDDTNFLTLARGVLADPWRPHAISINWSGTPERAFDVLSNPPGVAYLLALPEALAGPPWLYHLTLWPFTLLFGWAAWRLSHRFSADPPTTALLLVTSPAVVVSGHTLMPDLPLLAVGVAGLVLAIEGVDRGRPGRALGGALLLGSAAWFRYSGGCLPPLLALYVWLVRRRSPLGPGALAAVGVASVAPLGVLFVHDLLAYGEIHFLHMIAFQQEVEAPGKGLRQGVAQVLALGATATLPGVWLLVSSRPTRASALGAGLALVVGGAVIGWAGGIDERAGLGGPELLGALFLASGGALVGHGAEALRWGELRRAWAGRGGLGTDGVFLAAWVGGILVFNQALRFASVRYLLLAVPPALLLMMRGSTRGPSWRGGVAAGAAGLLSLGLSVADHRAAEVYRDAAGRIDGGGFFAGHWGLQRYMEARGATAVDEAGPALAPGTPVTVARMPWPQDLPPGTAPLEDVRAWIYEDGLPLRTLDLDPPTCFYANAVSTASPVPHPPADAPRLPWAGGTVAEVDASAAALAVEGAREAWLPWGISWGPQEILLRGRVGGAP